MGTKADNGNSTDMDSSIGSNAVLGPTISTLFKTSSVSLALSFRRFARLRSSLVSLPASISIRITSASAIV